MDTKDMVHFRTTKKWAWLVLCYCSLLFLLLRLILPSETYLKSNSHSEGIFDSNEQLEPKYSRQELIDKLTEVAPNIPYRYLDRVQRSEGYKCAQLPRIEDLRINNDVWQRFETVDSNIPLSLFLYSAHLDVREANPKPCIRFLAASSAPEFPTSAFPYCQIWMEDREEPLVSQVEGFIFTGWAELWNRTEEEVLTTPFMFSCPLPGNVLSLGTAIRAVSLVREACGRPWNALTVFNGDKLVERETHPKTNLARKNSILYCVKGLAFPFKDLSWALVEWLEVTRRLQVTKVVLYYLQLQPKTLEALHQYVKSGFLELVHFPLSGDQPNAWYHQSLWFEKKFISHIRHENTAQHDCFYRNMYDFDFISHIDTDEVISPQTVGTLPELISEIQAQQKDAYAQGHSLEFKHSYFFINHFPKERTAEEFIPERYTILRHFYRSKATVFKQAKSLHKTTHVVMTSTHRAKLCLPETRPCNLVHVNTSLAILNHYRHNCADTVTSKEYCQTFWDNYEADKVLWRFKEEVLQSVEEVMSSVRRTQRPWVVTRRET